MKMMIQVPSFYPLWMRDSIDYFEKEFKDYFSSDIEIPAHIKKITELAIFPGRRIRPSLYCGFYKLITSQFPHEESIYPAFAIELFHSAAIITDDLIDKDIKRRNKSSLYTYVGIEKSILISHLLVAQGYNALLKADDIEKIRLWNDSFQMSILGEYYDISKQNTKNIYNEIESSLNKTLGFFLFIGKSLEQICYNKYDLKNMFLVLGKAFQISNDFFDFFNFPTSQRHDNSFLFKLNKSFISSFLIDYKIISPNIINEQLTFEEYVSIVKQTEQIIGDWREKLEQKLLLFQNQINSIDLPKDIKDYGIDFIKLTNHQDFWEHNHVQKVFEN